MDANNSKSNLKLLNKPTACPWSSKAPAGLTPRSKSANDRKPENLAQNVNCHFAHYQPCSNNQMPGAAAMRCPSIQQSSIHFLNFLRLMQLFPSLHAATLHTALVLCKGNFFQTVDKLLYAERCKQLYNARKKMMQSCNCKYGRHKPYCCFVAPKPCQEPAGTSKPAASSQVQAAPLDATLAKNEPELNVAKEEASKPKVQEADLQKIVASRIKVNLRTASLNDLPPVVASLQCKLPIRPLSPMIDVPEDLSVRSTSSASVQKNKA